MIYPVRGGGRLCLVALAAGFAAWVVSTPRCQADGGSTPGDAKCPTCQRSHQGRYNQPGPGVGTLGYGSPGLYAGFQGFGLGYHLGYGYGGDALGVGTDGGYPFYGGPGYPHPWPTLRRLGPITPFSFLGGSGSPTPECPHYFGTVGPLVVEPPVVVIEREPNEADYARGYGAFTGALPYPESAFAPFVTAAAAGGTSSGVNSASPPNAPPNTNPASGELRDDYAASRTLGIDAEPFTDAGGGRGLKVIKVHAGSLAQKAGLRDGDVIRSINGYVTELPINLAWIVANVARDRILKMIVHEASDGQVRTISAQLP